MRTKKHRSIKQNENGTKRSKTEKTKKVAKRNGGQEKRRPREAMAKQKDGKQWKFETLNNKGTFEYLQE